MTAVFSFGSPSFNFSVGDRHRDEGVADGVGEGGVSDEDKRWDVIHEVITFRLESHAAPLKPVGRQGCRILLREELLLLARFADCYFEYVGDEA